MHELRLVAAVMMVVIAGCGEHDKPTPPPPPTGACCSPAGTCTVTTQVDCTAAWTAGGVCDPNSCVQPPPAGMVVIPAGTFTMGSPESESARDLGETQHQVILTRAFYMSDHEVTQAEWRSVMGTNPSYFAGDQFPVEKVNWYDCIDYCNARSVTEGLEPVYTRDGNTVTWNQAKNGYRLPTDAEWEYACRAGTVTAFHTGACLSTDQANYDGSAQPGCSTGGTPRVSTIAVRQLARNAWGLYDMHGNVREWCWDRYAPFRGDETDPTGPTTGSFRVARGGSWGSDGRYCRSAYRWFYDPEDGFNSDGFRVARNVR